MTLSVTSEIHAEFEAARERWLRTRFAWYAGFMVVFGLAGVLLALAGLDSLSDVLSVGFGAQMLVRGGQVALFGGALAWATSRARPLTRDETLRLVYWCILILGFASMLVAPLVSLAIRERTGDGPSAGPGAAWLGLLLVMHFSASLFIPWTPREAMRPMIPLLIVASALSLVAPLIWEGDTWAVNVPFAILLWTVVLPGMAVAYLRDSRFRRRFHLSALSSRYGALRRELVDAQRIHEAIFPAPVADGPLRFWFRYEPMRQIGGDFVFTHPWARGEGRTIDDRPFSVVLVDVTGHGVAAALTVNRLDGELRRLFSENPGIEPGAVIAALNSYIHYTLAEHSVYATAFCLRVDPGARTLQWSSAGHPPGMRRDAAGRITELGSTTFVLGACDGDDFDAGQRSAPFAQGDAVVLYTDGAFESRDADGKMLGLDGLRRAMAAAGSIKAGDGRLAEFLLEVVDRHRAGPPMDDTLILEVSCPVGAATAKGATQRSRAATAAPAG